MKGKWELDERIPICTKEESTGHMGVIRAGEMVIVESPWGP